MSVASSFTVKGKTKIKIVLLGNQNVGKTSIIQRYINDKFQDSQNPTIGIDFVVSNVQRNNKNYRLQLWDTAGQQRFKSLIPSYLKDSNCAIIIYDVSNEESASDIWRWLEMYNEHKDQSAFSVVVGNKTDLKSRFPNQEEIKRKSEKQNMHYLQVSAKSGQMVQELFHKMIDIVQENSHKNILQKDILQSPQKGQSPKKNLQTEANECLTAGIIKLDSVSKVIDDKDEQSNKKKRKCC